MKLLKRMLALALLLCLVLNTAFAATAKKTTSRYQEVADYIAALPEGAVADVSSSGLSLEKMANLVSTRPDLIYTWDIKMGSGVVIKGDVSDLDLDSLTKKDYTYKELRLLLTCLTQLEHITMFEQGLKVSQMEKLMAMFPEVTFEWTVRIGKYKIRTDATAFSTLKGRQDPRYTTKDLDALKYCTQLQAIDLGHNNVNDLSFLTQWPHLKVLIIVDSKKGIKDLSPLAELKELEYVELFMQDITDLSALADKPNLLDLNLCHNEVTDLSPLLGNTSLERLWISYNKQLSAEEITSFQEQMPGVLMETKEYQSTGAGWREHERYFVVKEIFETGVYRPFTDTAPTTDQ